MGNNSPSRRRREGWKAYAEEPFGDPNALCPYKDAASIDDWMKGWLGAEKEYEAEAEQKTAEEQLHDSIMSEIESLERSSSVSGLVMLLIERGILT